MPHFRPTPMRVRSSFCASDLGLYRGEDACLFDLENMRSRLVPVARLISARVAPVSHGAVPDSENTNRDPPVKKLIDDAVRADSQGPEASQSATKWVAGLRFPL